MPEAATIFLQKPRPITRVHATSSIRLSHRLTLFNNTRWTAKMADATIKTVHSFLQEHTSKVSGCTVRSYIHDHGKGPVLAMVHGYPQSAYMYIAFQFNLKA